MTRISKYELIVNDLLDRIPEDGFSKRYLSLYSDYSENLQKIFAYLHGGFDRLFEFMNNKNSTNKHFNADQSRELGSLISFYEDLDKGLEGSENEISLNSDYKKVLIYCKTFLQNSGGSAIPDEYEDISVIKYEPILKVTNKTISIPTLNQNNRLKLVGEGAFSIVKKYKDEYYNKNFAVKQAKKSITSRELERFKREFEILQGLQFPYILEVYRYDVTKDNYIMEYCDCTLKEYVDKNNQKLPFKNKKKIALQFLYGINYLHKKNILHRDISVNNILVKKYDFNSVQIKLSDFGLMKESQSDFTNADTEMKGTLIDPSLDSFKNYNVKNEIYAIGFILQFIFTGKRNLKFNGDGLSEILTKCTDKNLSARYNNVSQIIDDIDNLHT